jgi:hypothetical protein
VPPWPTEGQLNLFWIPLTIMTRYEQRISIRQQSSRCVVRKQSLYIEISNHTEGHIVKYFGK